MQKKLSGVIAADAGQHMRWDLQFFAESASGGEGGEGASETAAEAAGDPLDSLGIPKDKLERYKTIKGKQTVTSEQAETAEQDEAQSEKAAADEPLPAEDPEAEWKAVLENPEYNRRIQDIVQKRVAGMKASLDSLAPVIETLGQKYGMDVSDISKMDLGELAKHVSEDGKQTAGETEEQARRRYFDDLVRQGEALREKIPNFDLQRELQDPRFARMTAPGGGWTVEQAFNAVHHDALVKIAAEQATRQAAQALSNSVQAGKNLPAENGSVQRSATGTETKLYSAMSPEERRRYKEQLKNGTIHF